ncbi:MAG TPA: PQQ-binding-like beta-propeller repeat protein [Lacipirellulaceae bacterium]|nr:PQQ-binding-like beta-propeller repeat protein [Lacipirellulaceae bacterium]
MSSTETPRENTTIVAPRRRSVWRLIAWWGAVALALAGFWRFTAWQDYRNTSVLIAVLLAVFGASVWLLRNSGGDRRRRLFRALAVWAPLYVVSPLGPVKLIHNGNVGIVGWRWRWAAQPDEALQPAARRAARVRLTPGPTDYPAFLGGRHWAEVRGVELDGDWSARPPKLLWKQKVGAGWSGYAVVGDYAVTQEQRGPEELVVCYKLRTGEVAWSHADRVRWDPGGSGALGKVGPRATPTVHDGRVYAHGATGILNCLDGATGEALWSHDTLAEEQVPNIMWGKAGSPLIVGGWVVVSVGGAADNSLVAYDRLTGQRAWGAGSRRSSYATPVLATLQGVEQIVLVNEDFVTAHRASDGAVLWEHPWPGNSDSDASASQPTPVGDDRLLLTKGYSTPAQLISATRSEAGEWTAQTVWEKPVLRTKLSNVVVRDGYVYAIDDVDLVCVELATGKRRWKSRRRPMVGDGQILLVGAFLLVSSEAGEVILVEANPKKYVERGSFQAIEGVTWNNPALSGPYLLVRNDEEAACYELPLVGRALASDAAK